MPICIIVGDQKDNFRSGEDEILYSSGICYFVREIGTSFGGLKRKHEFKGDWNDVVGTVSLSIKRQR